MKIKIAIDLRTNRLVRNFILVDLALLAGWGLIQPILSVYIIETVPGATLVTVGIGAAIYWILKSLLQLPIATYLDKTAGEKDDFRVLVIGLLIGALAAFLFGMISRVWHFYAVEVIHAIAFAFYIPSWSAIFSRHLDTERVSFDWSLDSTVAGLSAGVSGFLGGILASLVGFQIVFVFAGVFSLIAALILLMAPEVMLPKKTSRIPLMKNHIPTSIGQ